MDSVEQKPLSQLEIVRAATNDPALAANTVTLGDRTFPVVDLPYDDYCIFMSYLQPFLEVIIGKIAAAKGMEFGTVNAASLVTYCSTKLPEMACIVCKQSDPSITVEDMKVLGKTPFKLAAVVLAQVEQNKIISEVADFFVSILPLLKLGLSQTTKATR